MGWYIREEVIKRRGNESDCTWCLVRPVSLQPSAEGGHPLHTIPYHRLIYSHTGTGSPTCAHPYRRHIGGNKATETDGQEAVTDTELESEQQSPKERFEIQCKYQCIEKREVFGSLTGGMHVIRLRITVLKIRSSPDFETASQ